MKPIPINAEIEVNNLLDSMSSEEILEFVEIAQKQVLEPKFDLQLLHGAIDSLIEDVAEFGYVMDEKERSRLLIKMQQLSEAVCGVKNGEPNRFRLSDLLENVNETNTHGEVCTGNAVGNEIW
jgi:hypothetical protein